MVTRRIARNENQGKPIGAPDQPRPAIFASTRSKASAPALHQSRSSEPARPSGWIPVSPATHSPRACHHLLRSQPRRIGFGSPPGTRFPCGSTANYHAPLSKPAKTGTFYFAQIRNFLFCLDTGTFYFAQIRNFLFCLDRAWPKFHPFAGSTLRVTDRVMRKGFPMCQPNAWQPARIGFRNKKMLVKIGRY